MSHDNNNNNDNDDLGTIIMKKIFECTDRPTKFMLVGSESFNRENLWISSPIVNSQPVIQISFLNVKKELDNIEYKYEDLEAAVYFVDGNLRYSYEDLYLKQRKSEGVHEDVAGWKLSTQDNERPARLETIRNTIKILFTTK